VASTTARRACVRTTHYHENYYDAFAHDPDGHNIEPSATRPMEGLAKYGQCRPAALLVPMLCPRSPR
jgi:hypothetical protein